MKTRTLLATLAVAGMAGNALAVSPYELPLGMQWSFMIGSAGTGANNPTGIAVTADGTIWVHDTAHNSDAWGHGGSTGSIGGSVGSITKSGQLNFALSQRDLPGLVVKNQSYSAGVSAVGNTAYFATESTQGWFDLSYKGGENQGGTDRNRAQVYSFDASGINSIGNENTLSYWTTNGLVTARTDADKPILPGGGLNSAGGFDGQNRINDQAMMASTLKMVMGGDGVGEFATAGDWGGLGIRANGSNSFQPQIAVYDFNTKTLTGPAFQPVVGVFDGVQNHHADYFDVDIDQVSGFYYGGGLSHARNDSTSTSWDPDGAGGAAGTINFANSVSAATTAGIGTAYNASNALLYSVTWDSAGTDIINAIAAANDGTNAAFWAGENADESYVEKRDASGAVVWSAVMDMSPAYEADPVNNPGVFTPGVERVVDVVVDVDGNLVVTGYADTTGGVTTSRDSYVRMYK